MNNNPHHRHSIRVPGFDYSQAGAYFITICAYQHMQIFGEILHNKPALSPIGLIVEECWKSIPDHFPNVELGVFVIMPNHIHGIIHITSNDDAGRGTACCAPTPNNESTFEKFGQPVANSIPTIVRSYKSAVTKRVNEITSTTGISLWQRNYYESIILADETYSQIEGYILNNPFNWVKDPENQ